MMINKENFDLCTTEIFGPFFLITEYDDNDIDLLLKALEQMKNHLTAGIVSNDPLFQDLILGLTNNGTTYVGIKAKTTGAPANHYFGPGGDPRSAGIGTPESIRNVWTHHREIITDHGPVDKNFKFPCL